MLNTIKKPVQISCTEDENFQINLELSRAKNFLLEKKREKKNNPEIFLMALKELNKQLEDLI